MKVGHARYCLSPQQKEFYLIGYRSTNRMEPATGIHDDIYCNSLLFEKNHQQVFVFSADFLEFEEDMVEDVKTLLQHKYGILRDCILLSATHNHSSIVSYHHSWYTGKFNQEYYDFLIQIICQSYETSQANLQEATAKYGKGEITGYYGNRNHPGQKADNEVIVINFYNNQNVAFAGMINWAVHSTVISDKNTYLTSEWAGNVSTELAKDFGFYPLIMVGAAGDCSNRNERQGNDFKELKRVAVGMADAIKQIPINKDIIMDEIKYQTIYHTVHHDMKFVHNEIETEIKRYQNILEIEEDDNKKQFLSNKIKNLSKDLKINSFHLDAKALVINLGKIQLFVFPGELGSKFGKELKDACSTLAIICGYTNGYYEYFMPKEEYGLSFETIGCRVPKGEPEKLIQKFIQTSHLLNR